MQRLTGFLLIIGVIIAASSCSVKNLQYVQGAFDTARLSKIQFVDPAIQKGDLLGITLYSDDAAATAAVMPQTTAVTASHAGSMGSSSGPSAAGAATGYTVNEDGFIQLYKLGFIKAEGLTKKQLADTLARRYVTLNLLKNPYVEIRFLNYKFTVVGEVSKPGTYTVPTEKVNIFEAIGLAGDITVYGKRNNLKLIRESNGVREFAQLDLSKPEIFASPYFYLQQNDMIIVEVGKNKAIMNDQLTTRNITVGASILATIAIFINIFR